MRRTVLVLALVGLVAGGCVSRHRLSSGEFVARGNAICQAAADKLEVEADKAFGSAEPTTSQLLTFTAKFLFPATEDQIAQLDALTPPKSLEDELDDALTEARKALRAAKADPTAVIAEDDTTFDRANELLAKAGLATCAQD